VSVFDRKSSNFRSNLEVRIENGEIGILGESATAGKNVVDFVGFWWFFFVF